MEVEFEGLKITLQGLSAPYEGVIVGDLGFLVDENGKLGMSYWEAKDIPKGEKLLKDHPGVLEFAQYFLERADKLRSFE